MMDNVGIDLDEVMADLLADGIVKFVTPFDTLMAALKEKVDRLAIV